MPDWTKPMQQTFEYYIVDPGTWKNKQKVDVVTSSSIERDSESDTLGSATIDVTGTIDECYIRIYLVTIQNRIKESFPLGTYLVQTPSYSFDGKIQTSSLDAYTPLMELKEKYLPIGYSLFKDPPCEIMDTAYRLARENMRAPVSSTNCKETLEDDFVANVDDTYLKFLTDLISKAKYEFEIDELGQILFSPIQDIEGLQPVWTYNDDNSSILYPDISMERDLYGIPNVVEVVYSTGNTYKEARVVNEDENSPTSIKNRGREIIYRETNPNLVGNPTSYQIKDYAEQLLKSKSSLEFTVSYSHGYCPVRVGDCVRLNYERAGITDIKAKVISQSISCTSGCKVTEKAVFTRKFWG